MIRMNLRLESVLLWFLGICAVAFLGLVLVMICLGPSSDYSSGSMRLHAHSSVPAPSDGGMKIRDVSYNPDGTLSFSASGGGGAVSVSRANEIYTDNQGNFRGYSSGGPPRR
jgi:hypothetical protein